MGLEIEEMDGRVGFAARDNSRGPGPGELGRWRTNSVASLAPSVHGSVGVQ